MYKKKLHNTKKHFFSITLIEMETANVQENITQHKKTFFSIILIKIAKGNVQENISLHKKNDFLALFWLKSQKEMYKKILHNT